MREIYNQFLGRYQRGVITVSNKTRNVNELMCSTVCNKIFFFPNDYNRKYFFLKVSFVAVSLNR